MHDFLRDASGEYGAVYRPFHLIGLELGISVASAVLRGEATGSAEGFIADVASVAKKDLNRAKFWTGRAAIRFWPPGQGRREPVEQVSAPRLEPWGKNDQTGR